MGEAFSGAVLTGGASTRMGRDKATLALAGRPLAGYGREALRAGGAVDVVAIGGPVRELEALGFVVVADEFQATGPLGGIVTALAHATEDLAVVLGCDTPLVDGPTVRRLVDAARDAPGAVASVDGRPEPLIAAYRRALEPELRSALEAGQRAVHRATEGCGLVAVPIDRLLAANVNEPADVLRLEKVLSRTERRSTWPGGGGR